MLLNMHQLLDHQEASSQCMLTTCSSSCSAMQVIKQERNISPPVLQNFIERKQVKHIFFNSLRNPIRTQLGMDAVPEEVLAEVLCYVHPTELFRMATVCSAWYCFFLLVVVVVASFFLF